MKSSDVGLIIMLVGSYFVLDEQLVLGITCWAAGFTKMMVSNE